MKLIIILLTIFCVIPTFATPSISVISSDIGWFIIIYIIAAYIRLYPNKLFEKKKENLFIFIASYSFMLLSVVFMNLMAGKVEAFKDNTTYFATQDNIPIVIASISIFLFFKNINIKYNKYINTIASCTLGVYLFHDNIFAREIIWLKIFNNPSYSNAKTINLCIHIIVAVVSVYVVATAFDILRKELLEDKIFSFIEHRKQGKARIKSGART